MKNELWKNYYTDNTKTEEIDGRQVISVFSNVEDEYNIIRTDNAFIDGSGYAIVKVTGDGAVSFLDALATKDIQFLNIDTLAECLFLNDDAKALGAVWVVRGDEDYYAVIPPESAKAVLTWMDEKKPDDVELENVDETKALIFVEGRKAWKIVQEVLSVDVNAIPFRGVQEIADYKGSQLLLARIGRTGEYGYMVMGDAQGIETFVKEGFEFAKGAGLKLEFCGSQAEEICMIETRQPNFRYENADAGNVFELCQQWLIQFEKEGYFGADALKESFAGELAAESVGFACKDNIEIPSGAKIFLDDEEIGTVVYAKKSPKAEATLGIAKLNLDYAVSGIVLSVDADGAKHEIETISSPFVRPMSWDEKME